VNFSKNTPACVYPNDYETFLPEGGSNQCVLGRQLNFTRKMQSSLCQPDPTILNSFTYSACNCTRADYYCVYCFIPDSNNTCVLDSSNPLCTTDPAIPANCTPGKALSLPSAYRKVANTYCVNDVPQYIAARAGVCPVSPAPATTATATATATGTASMTTTSIGMTTSAPVVRPPPALTGGWIALIVIVVIIILAAAGVGLWRFIVHQQGAKFDPELARGTLESPRNELPVGTAMDSPS